MAENAAWFRLFRNKAASKDRSRDGRPKSNERSAIGRELSFLGGAAEENAADTLPAENQVMAESRIVIGRELRAARL